MNLPNPKTPESIYVTKANVPDAHEYASYISQILSSRQLTNGGGLSQRLECNLCDKLQVPHVTLCANGTLSLQLALHAAQAQQRAVITTPFSYVATLSALLWEGCQPVFVDIDPETLCLDPALLASAAVENPAAILPVHIYGSACAIESIDRFATSSGLQVIYDAAQAFGSEYAGKSLLSYGDFSVASFHATKIFHTIEGGAVISHSDDADQHLRLLRAYGHIGDEYFIPGINAKMAEPQAAMGLCLLPTVDQVITERQCISAMYDSMLPRTGIRKPVLPPALRYNYAYYAVIFDTEAILLRVVEKLGNENIFPRRYFYPALNTLPYLKDYHPCPVAEDIASRVLALPLYNDMGEETVARISRLIREVIG